MGKRIGLRDFSVRATDKSRDNGMYCIHRRLSVCLAWLNLLSGLVLLVIFAVLLVAQTMLRRLMWATHCLKSHHGAGLGPYLVAALVLAMQSIPLGTSNLDWRAVLPVAGKGTSD
jgi:hypothetical protein